MKLKNLLFATMFACAFASCSSDDDPVIDNGGGDTPVAKDEAVLVLNMAGVQTRSDVVNVTDENAINNSTVVVFNGSDETEAVLEATGKVNQNNDTKEEIRLTPGNKIVLVLANYKDQISAETKFSDFLQKEIDFANYEGQNGTLTMNSSVYKVSLASGQKNYLGYATASIPKNGNNVGDEKGTPVYLYHNVAKVILNNVEVDLPKEIKSQYPNPRLDVKEVFILHAHKNSKLFTKEAWGSTDVTDNYLNSVGTAETYAQWVEKVKDKKEVFKYLVDPKLYAQDGYTTTKYEQPISLGWKSNIDTDKNEIKQGEKLPGKWDKENKTVFYTYENMNIGDEDIYTLLVVKGDFSYDGYKDKKATRITDYNRYYSVAVGVTGFADGYSIPGGVPGLDANLRTPNVGSNYKGVIRNLQYKVGMTVRGPGYDTPVGPDGGNNTFLLVNVKVVDFGNVDQEAEFN